MRRDKSLPTALVASDIPYARSLLQQSLRQQQFTVLTAPSVAAALEHVEKTPLDLLVIDLVYPPEASEQLLLRVRVTGNQVPALMLGATMDRDLLSRLVNLGPVGFVTKPLHLAALRELLPLALRGDRQLLQKSLALAPSNAARSRAGAAAGTPTPVFNPAEQRLDESRLQSMLGSLPLLPHVFTAILEMSSDSDLTAQALADIIGGDPRLSSQLLKVVNSAYFGFARRIATIAEAIVILGMEAIRRLAISASVSNFFGGRGELLDRQRMWQHAIAVAMASRTVAQRAGGFNPDEAFSAGLLHDFGRLALERHMPAAYRDVLLRAREQALPLVEVEEQVLGVNHAWVSGWLARQWNLPDSLVEALVWHHEPENAPEAMRRLTASVHVGNVLCHLADCSGVEAVIEVTEPAPYALSLLGLPANALEGILPVVMQETAEFQQQLETASAGS